MLVRSLRVQNFRNYPALDIQFGEGVQAFVGDNGQGKTNLLEAVCVLATTKSPLTNKDRDLIRWTQKEAQLSATVETVEPYVQQRLLEFSWKLQGNSISRQMRLQGIPQEALMYWLGQLQVVAFFPHDLSIVYGDPAQRRRFINMELGKNNQAYFHDLLRYRQVLKQRNALLRQHREHCIDKSTFAPLLAELTHQLTGYGSRVFAQRAHFISQLQPLAQEVHQTLAGRDMQFQLSYRPGLFLREAPDLQQANWNQWMKSAVKSRYNADLARGVTSAGPHRDDLGLHINDIELRQFGSQGQQRLAVLALKLALARWTWQHNQEAPVLLLDDAFSELDKTRRELLLDFAQSFPQSFVTVTDDEMLQNVAATRFHVSNNSLQKYFS